MTLVDVCDFAESLAIADHVYMREISLRRMRSPLACITASTNRCTTLRWAVLPDMGRNMLLSLYTGINHLRETEKAATALFDRLCKVRGSKINQETIQFIQPLYDLQDIGKDE